MPVAPENVPRRNFPGNDSSLESVINLFVSIKRIEPFQSEYNRLIAIGIQQMMLDFLEKCSDLIYAYIHDTFDTYEMTRTKVRLRVNEVKKIKEDRGNLRAEIPYR